MRANESDKYHYVLVVWLMLTIVFVGLFAHTAHATNYDRSFNSPGISLITVSTGSHVARVTGFNLPRITSYEIHWFIRMAEGVWNQVKISDLGVTLGLGTSSFEWDGTQFVFDGDGGTWAIPVSYVEVRAQIYRSGSYHESHYWNVTGQVVEVAVSTASNPVDGGNASGGGTYESGTEVTVCANANSGYSFLNWTDNNTPVSSSACYAFIASENRLLVANFILENEGEEDVCTEECAQGHPGDTNGDWRIVMSEAIPYLGGWQAGEHPMAYAIRGAFLWQNGEQYTCMPDISPPMCWVVLSSEKVCLESEPDAGSATLTRAHNNIVLTITPPVNTLVWGAELYLPAGIIPLHIAGPKNAWDRETGKVSWWNTGDGQVLLEVAPQGATGTHMLAGAANFDGVDVPFGLDQYTISNNEEEEYDYIGQQGEAEDGQGDTSDVTHDQPDEVNTIISHEEAPGPGQENAPIDTAANATEAKFAPRCGTVSGCVKNRGNALESICRKLADWLLFGLSLMVLMILIKIKEKI